MTPDAARDLALAAFSFIAADPDEAAALMDASGAGPQALRRMAEQPEFSAFIIDFLMENDARVLAFARAEGVAPERLAAARHALGGGWD